MRVASKRSRLVESVRRRPGVVALLLLPVLLVASLYLVNFKVDHDFDRFSLYRFYNIRKGRYNRSDHPK